MLGFVSRLEEINALAEQSDGFIWRLQDESGDATAIRAFDDPNLLINMSVWRDMQSLRNFVYRSIHTELLRQKDSWFTQPTKGYQVLWWLPEGQLPTLEQAKLKIELIQRRGATAEAFDFSKPFEPPS